jgi:hypothetical protein
MITLFSERPELNQRPYTFLVSIVLHGTVVALVALGIISAPKVRTPAPGERMAVRHIDLHTIESEMQRARNRIEYPRSLIKHIPAPAPRPAEQQQAMRQPVQAPKGPQTLLQPDIPKPVVLAQEIPVPTVVIWNGQNTPAKTLVAPLPDKPAVAAVQPSVQLPNKEQNIADIAIASTDLPVPPQPVLPSTTSPVVVQGPTPTPPAPVTTTLGTTQPTPTALMSLSDLHLANGNVSLPPVNQSASLNSAGALAAGKATGAAHAGKTSTDDKAAGKGVGQGADRASVSSDHATNSRGADSGSAHSASGKDTSGQKDTGQIDTGLANHTSTAHISLPHDGQFGAVVVGSSMEDKYPETGPVWNGRIAYTVYLHVGLAHSWILQYSLPRNDEAAASGNIAHIEAPWPYNIVRPNITPGAIDADALMIHGFVNQAGRFEALSVVFPPQFAQTQFVLNSLAQWQFRPATQNGQNSKVEVLLIIPEESE